MDDNDTTDKNDTHKTCIMTETDETGNPNLCCCYIMDTSGNYEDPCFYPANECC